MSSPNNPFEFFYELSKPIWYYEKADLKKSPSFEDGIPSETELRYRSEGPKFIQKVGTSLDLNYMTIATASVYFHRFYMKHSFKKFHRYVVATCCLFVAGKVEETPKKCKDLMKAAKANLAESQWVHFGEYPRDEVMTLEKVLLHSIQFDFQVEHPYKYLLRYVKALKAPQDKMKVMMQMAWTFVNDSLSTTLCLLWEPQIIAVAVMHLSGRLNKFTPSDWSTSHQSGKWWEKFVPGVERNILDEICHKILDQYSGKEGLGGKKAQEGKRERPKTPKREGEPHSKMQKVQTPQKAKVGKGQPGRNLQVKQENNVHPAPASNKKPQVSRVMSSIAPAKAVQQPNMLTPNVKPVQKMQQANYDSKPIETIGGRTNSVASNEQTYNNNNQSSFPLNTISTELTMTSHSNHDLNMTSHELMTSQPPLPSPYQQQQNPPLPPQQTFPNLNPSTNILPPPPQFNIPVTSYNQQVPPVTSYQQQVPPVTSYQQQMTSPYIPRPPQQQQQIAMANYQQHQHVAQQQGYGYQQQQGGYNNRAPHSGGNYNNRGSNRGRGKKSNGGWQSML